MAEQLKKFRITEEKRRILIVEDEFINQYELPLLGSIPDFDTVLSASNYKSYYGKNAFRRKTKNYSNQAFTNT